MVETQNPTVKQSEVFDRGVKIGERYSYVKGGQTYYITQYYGGRSPTPEEFESQIAKGELKPNTYESTPEDIKSAVTQGLARESAERRKYRPEEKPKGKYIPQKEQPTYKSKEGAISLQGQTTAEKYAELTAKRIEEKKKGLAPEYDSTYLRSKRFYEERGYKVEEGQEGFTARKGDHLVRISKAGETTDIRGATEKTTIPKGYEGAGSVGLRAEKTSVNIPYQQKERATNLRRAGYDVEITRAGNIRATRGEEKISITPQGEINRATGPKAELPRGFESAGPSGYIKNENKKLIERIQIKLREAERKITKPVEKFEKKAMKYTFEQPVKTVPINFNEIDITKAQLQGSFAGEQKAFTISEKWAKENTPTFAVSMDIGGDYQKEFKKNPFAKRYTEEEYKRLLEENKKYDKLLEEKTPASLNFRKGEVRALVGSTAIVGANVVKGGVQTAFHLPSATWSMAQLGGDVVRSVGSGKPVGTVKETIKQFRTKPLETTGQMIGSTIVFAGVGKSLGFVARKVSGRISPKVAKKLLSKEGLKYSYETKPKVVRGTKEVGIVREVVPTKIVKRPLRGKISGEATGSWYSSQGYIYETMYKTIGRKKYQIRKATTPEGQIKAYIYRVKKSGKLKKAGEYKLKSTAEKGFRETDIYGREETQLKEGISPNRKKLFAEEKKLSQRRTVTDNAVIDTKTITTSTIKGKQKPQKTTVIEMTPKQKGASKIQKGGIKVQDKITGAKGKTISEKADWYELYYGEEEFIPKYKKVKAKSADITVEQAYELSPIQRQSVSPALSKEAGKTVIPDSKLPVSKIVDMRKGQPAMTQAKIILEKKTSAKISKIQKTNIVERGSVTFAKYKSTKGADIYLKAGLEQDILKNIRKQRMKAIAKEQKVTKPKALSGIEKQILKEKIKETTALNKLRQTIEQRAKARKVNQQSRQVSKLLEKEKKEGTLQANLKINEINVGSATRQEIKVIASAEKMASTRKPIFISIPRMESKAVTSVKPIVSSFMGQSNRIEVGTIPQYKIITEQESRAKEETKEESISKSRDRLGLNIDTSQKQQPKEEQKQQQEQKQEQQQKQITKQIGRFKPRTRQTTKFEPPPDTPPPPKPFLRFGEKEDYDYLLFVRKRGKFKLFGKYKKPSQAFARGKAIVSESASASLKVKGPSGYERPRGILSAKQFYPSAREKGVYVERPEMRIKSAGEKGEITYKGLAKLRLIGVMNRRKRWGF